MELIERAEIVALLQNELDHIADGEGHCVFVSGEAGIGKTSLVKAFCMQQKDDCVIYRGACDALFTPRPLAPVYDIIWQVGNNLWPGSHTIEERSELFLKFFHELKNKKEKILIVFDDIHWADEATLDFIKFLARRISQLQCLFILTYRDDEVNPGHPLRNVLGALSPDIFTRIHLEPLSRQAVYKLANEKGYDAENVYNISGGNPFYVTEILASYSPGVPDNIRDSILAVYNRQEEGTRNAWEICSIIPEGLEVNRFARLKSSWEGMDRCFALKIIIIKNDRVIFKHELYRRTIESTLSPFKRIALNKRMLDLFLDSFEEQGDIERIVHYAKNANENEVVVKYAPVAAKQAAAVGAHIEASKLYLTAIEYSNGRNMDQILAFYDAYAYECYLTNQTKEAIIYYGKALELWKQKGEPEKVSYCLYFLSRLWWISDNLIKAERYAEQAIEVLDSQPTSRAKAMAFSLMSQLKMFSDLSDECIQWGQKAIRLAEELSDDAILSYALGNVGSVQTRIPALSEKGLAMLQQSLDIALQNSYEDYAGMAYVNLAYNGMIIKNYTLAEEALITGITYCEENNLDLWRLYLLTIKARFKLDTGNWTEAHDISNKLVEDEKATKIIKIFAATILAKIKMRRGDNDAIPFLLKDATDKAFETLEPQRIIQAMAAFLEFEWLMGTRIIEKRIVESAIEMTKERGNIYGNSEFAFWLKKARGQSLPMKELYEGYDISSSEKSENAARLWKKIGCPYNEALVLFEGGDEDKRKAITIVQGLGASAVYQKMKSEMRSSGIKKIPRGLRESTKSNPLQLTNRELDVLQLLQKGVQNKEIAESLFISPKTVDNHISSILFKLDVNSRGKAVGTAIQLGILKYGIAI
jgi:DNA-binding CsgD family transcriptional regulator/tetratricopeptide (TPR) repeat protein